MWGTIILAGGMSKRMKEDKVLMKLGDKPLLLHIIEKVLGLTRETIVVVGKNDDLKNYSSLLPLTVTLLRDDVEGIGPLAGMLTGMRSMKSKYALVLPCDSPFVNREVLKYLLNKTQGADAAIPQWPNGQIEPLHAVYKVSSAIPALETTLRRGELFIIDMIKRLDEVLYVSTEKIRELDQELITFFNINFLEDFKTAERLLSMM
ncbi:molybdenum cofactor guanylyltransferase [Candidatus Bathyarchaeota archaeon]|nr:molybdenum cofactor guanylyltransferase [Candidatus Bathyarchaeota archaeon]